MNDGGKAAAPIPAGDTLWSFSLASPAQISITVETSDTNPVAVIWGDGTFEDLAHAAATTHDYAAGSFELKLADAARITKIDISANAGFGGVVGVTVFSALANINASGCDLDSFDAGSIPAATLTFNVNSNSLDAGTIDGILEALNNAGGLNGNLDYGLNTGSTDEARSPEGMMAKAALSGKGWLIVT